MILGYEQGSSETYGIDGNMSTIFLAVAPKTASNERIQRRPLATVFNEPCTTRVFTTKWYIDEIDKIVDLKTRKMETASGGLKGRCRRRRRRPNDPWKRVNKPTPLFYSFSLPEEEPSSVLFFALSEGKSTDWFAAGLVCLSLKVTALRTPPPPPSTPPPPPHLLCPLLTADAQLIS